MRPGSLGVEAIDQVVQWFVLESGLAEGLAHPRFEAVPGRWKYRGQVVTTDGVVTIEAEVTDVVREADSRTVFAEAWLWVDGRRIYHLPRYGVRVRAGSGAGDSAERLSLGDGSWLGDHRPSYTV